MKPYSRILQKSKKESYDMLSNSTYYALIKILRKGLNSTKRLGRFGRMTEKKPNHLSCVVEKSFFPKMSRALMKMLGNDVLLIGPKGIGKSKIIQEFARRIDACDPMIPQNTERKYSNSRLSFFVLVLFRDLNFKREYVFSKIFSVSIPKSFLF